MRVSELIKALKVCDQSAEVFVNYDGEFCSGINLEEPELIRLKVPHGIFSRVDTLDVVLLTLEGESTWELPHE